VEAVDGAGRGVTIGERLFDEPRTPMATAIATRATRATSAIRDRVLRAPPATGIRGC